MRLTWLVLGSALALSVLLAFWLKPVARDSVHVVVPASGQADGGPRNLESASPSPGERVRVENSSAEVTVPGDTEEGPTVEESLQLLRVRFVDAENEEPLVGCSLLVRKDLRPDVILQSTDQIGESEVWVEPGKYRAYQVGIAGDPKQVAREIRPQYFEVQRGTPDEPYLVVLHGRYPPAVLPVQVDHQDGAPVKGASVVFNAVSNVQNNVDPRVKTDARGRAWVGIWDPEAFIDGELYAKDDHGNVSDYLPIDAPLLPGVRQLVIAQGGSVEVLVVEAHFEPVEGRVFLITSALKYHPLEYQKTDEEGRITFEQLAPGSYHACDRGSASAPPIANPVQLVHVQRGEVQTVEFRLEEREPAVSGRVIDEQGEPLTGVGLVVTRKGGRSQSIRTEEDGSFSFYEDEAGPFLLEANFPAEGDVYEPGSLEVPFGAYDVLFTRVRQAELRSFRVEVFDLTNGAAIEHFVATIDRGPSSEKWSYPPQLEYELPVLPETRLRVSSKGYIERSLELKRVLDGLEEMERLRVGLAPGLDYSCSVLNAETFKPLPGVLFRSELAGDVRSDDGGVVHFQAPEWSVYRVSSEGYESDEWDPNDHVLWQFGSILLVPAENGVEDGD